MKTAQETSVEAETMSKPPRRRWPMNAYYYGFEATGVAAIDEILEAVAWAGKAYHHTEDWNERSHEESSVVDMIQAAAGRAAAKFQELE